MNLKSNEEESGFIFQNILRKLYNFGIECKLQKNTFALAQYDKYDNYDFNTNNNINKHYLIREKELKGINKIEKENIGISKLDKNRTIEEKIILNMDKLQIKIEQIENEYEYDKDRDRDKNKSLEKAEILMNLYLKVIF
jgi:hypothetical protein